MKTKMPNRRVVIAIAVFVSLIIYMAGVFSGLYAKKVIEIKVEEDVGKVEKAVDLLKNYIDTSSLDLKNMLLLQFFTDNVVDNCKFSQLYLGNLHKRLKEYWDRLPFRLESYEKENKETEEYKTLKREYIRLSLRLWLTAVNNQKKCESSDFVPVLYFYSRDCETCEEQGEILDNFRENLNSVNKTLILAPIEESFEDDSVFILKQYYNITHFPAIIINENVFQQDIIPLENLSNSIK